MLAHSFDRLSAAKLGKRYSYWVARKKKKQTILDLAKAGGSKVALAARSHSGAGRHGKQGAARRRAERRAAKVDIRQGDYD